MSHAKYSIKGESCILNVLTKELIVSGSYCSATCKFNRKLEILFLLPLCFLFSAKWNLISKAVVLTSQQTVLLEKKVSRLLFTIRQGSFILDNDFMQ